MPHRLFLTCLLSAGLALSACAKKPLTVAPANTAAAVGRSDSTTRAIVGASAGEASPLPGNSTTAPAIDPSRIYFDYDSSEIKPEYAATLSAYGKRLARDAALRLRLEGNTDERGSAEYNIGLGERRAQAVRHALLFQGAAAGELTTVSYGAARPVADGHGEADWARNRRVDLVYVGSH